MTVKVIHLCLKFRSNDTFSWVDWRKGQIVRNCSRIIFHLAHHLDESKKKRNNSSRATHFVRFIEFPWRSKKIKING